MNIRLIDKRIGLVAVHDNGRDLDYRFYLGQFTVSYGTDRKKKDGRKMRMHRTLDPNSAKAAEIKAILDGVA